MNLKRHCTSVVSAVPLLIGIEKKTGVSNESFSRLLFVTMLRPLRAFWTYDQPTCNSRGSPMGEAYYRLLIPSLVPSPPPQLSSLAVYELQATILIIAVVEDWVQG